MLQRQTRKPLLQKPRKKPLLQKQRKKPLLQRQRKKLLPQKTKNPRSKLDLCHQKVDSPKNLSALFGSLANHPACFLFVARFCFSIPPDTSHGLWSHFSDRRGRTTRSPRCLAIHRVIRVGSRIFCGVLFASLLRQQKEISMMPRVLCVCDARFLCLGRDTRSGSHPPTSKRRTGPSPRRKAPTANARTSVCFQDESARTSTRNHAPQTPL